MMKSEREKGNSKKNQVRTVLRSTYFFSLIVIE